jgi:hypothetical protein
LLGLATSTRLSGTVKTRYSAFAAVTVDFPHCREQFKIPRFAVDRSTSACRASGWKHKRVLANSTSSIRVFGRLITRRVPSPTKVIWHIPIGFCPAIRAPDSMKPYHYNRPLQHI